MQRADLDVDRLRALLPGWTVTWTAATGSTNADALARAGQGAPGPELHVTEEQSAGRGRFDRVWTSPRGAGLTFSLLLRPAAPVATWGWLPLLTGLALAQTVRASTGVDAGLKWPNDLLDPDGRKLAGVLVQGAQGAAVYGIGLNVSTTAGELPVETAASLSLAGAVEVDRTALLAGVTQAVQSWTARFDEDGADGCGLAGAYRRACVTLGRPVRVSLGVGGELVGTADAIGADGSLTVRSADGSHSVTAGDVEHVR